MASATIHCTVVKATEVSPCQSDSDYDLLPWADPYIASLFRDLQRHEHEERERMRVRRSCIKQVFEAEPMPATLETDLASSRWSMHVA